MTIYTLFEILFDKTAFDTTAITCRGLHVRSSQTSLSASTLKRKQIISHSLLGVKHLDNLLPPILRLTDYYWQAH